VTWTKEEYGVLSDKRGGRWTITNGHLRFDVHVMYDGSGRKEKYPDGVIISVDQADEYVDKIINALNEANVKLER